MRVRANDTVKIINIDRVLALTIARQQLKPSLKEGIFEAPADLEETTKGISTQE